MSLKEVFVTFVRLGDSGCDCRGNGTGDALDSEEVLCGLDAKGVDELPTFEPTTYTYTTDSYVMI